MSANNHTFKCPVCHLDKPSKEGRPAEFVSGPLSEAIRKSHPEWGPGKVICLPCLRQIRREFLEDMLEAQKGELSNIEEEVLSSLKEHEIISHNVNPEFDQTLTFGERLADRVASFGGSWGFIILFAGVIVVWIGINSFLMLQRPFDPYPYILLNLVLSCLAAIQAPVIMMSQNRQEAKDRMRAEHDYQVNLKAEIEIRQLHTKIDQLTHHSWQRLLEIQRVQIDLMEEMATKRKS